MQKYRKLLDDANKWLHFCLFSVRVPLSHPHLLRQFSFIVQFNICGFPISFDCFLSADARQMLYRLSVLILLFSSKSIVFTLHLDENRAIFAQIYGFCPTFGRKCFVVSENACILALKKNEGWVQKNGELVQAPRSKRRGKLCGSCCLPS